jgi:shikimate dehydrogenase
MAKEKNSRLFGLIGKNIAYSFSKEYFETKFKNEKITNCNYINFDLENIQEFTSLFNLSKPIVNGFNVTIPYKEAIIPYLDVLTPEAKAIGAVNCIEISASGQKIGHNTDWIGFTKSIAPFVKNRPLQALILGTGGASKGIQFALNRLQIPFQIVTRYKTNSNHLNYKNLDEEHLKSHQLIINCTPLGTFPNTHLAPEIPQIFFTKKNILFDLVYNPPFTTLMRRAASQGSIIKNGYEMLTIQAEESWTIWNQ